MNGLRSVVRTFTSLWAKPAFRTKLRGIARDDDEKAVCPTPKLLTPPTGLSRRCRHACMMPTWVTMCLTLCVEVVPCADSRRNLNATVRWSSAFSRTGVARYITRTHTAAPQHCNKCSTIEQPIQQDRITKLQQEHSYSVRGQGQRRDLIKRRREDGR